MNITDAAMVFEEGELVNILTHTAHNGIIDDRSSGRIKAVEYKVAPLPNYGGTPSLIMFTLEELTEGTRTQYLCQFPERIKYSDGELTFKDNHHYFTVKRQK
ncbi:hypothetical protein IFU39_03330 [Paenibacillus sp. CFBP 13594]|uniref:hypothetical protein n=1 Tax=Paenibacillus sp. CFBP 13594 TaxID=2774037 RepID=UPI00177FEE3B|nr:hypothetical protein [Paenibacillus sp. CFBP 13594]MBD8836857.1 hypothetical protein [Paenibacillus sp. CFBP 13594]